MLLKSQREPEERKLAYMGHPLANVVFDSSISAELAHQLIKTAEQLTYRQLCILRLAVVRDHVPLRTTDYRGQSSFQKDLYQVLYECLDLYHRALINFGGEVAFGPTDVTPNAMSVQGMGADLYNLMRLASIPEIDVMAIAETLK